MVICVEGNLNFILNYKFSRAYQCIIIYFDFNALLIIVRSEVAMIFEWFIN